MHADDVLTLPDKFTIAGCCDADAMRAREFAAKYAATLCVTDFAALCASRDIDVIAIATPPSSHHAMVLEALAAGKHVVCEKPFVSSLAEVDSIRDVQARSTSRVMPIFQYRFGQGIANARHLINSGIVGKHYVSAIETAKLRGPGYYAAAWRGKFATELGGVLVTQAIHPHDLLCWLVGPIKSVVAFKTTRVNPIEVEDCAVAGLQLGDGSLATLTATLGSLKPVTRMRFCFENVTFEKVAHHDGTRPGDEPWEIVPRNEEVGKAVAALLQEVPRVRPWFAGQYEAFHHALVTDGPLPVTLDDARASLELITALYEASATNSAVSLPIGPDHPRYHGWAPHVAPTPARKITA